MVTQIHNKDELDKFISSNSNQRVLYIYSDWAVQCAQIHEVIKILSGDPKNAMISFAQASAESIQDFCKNNNVNSVPSVLAFERGKEAARVKGANPSEITQMVAKLSAGSSLSAASSEDLSSRLKQLINQAPVMLFMKGSPTEPRCGFSRQILQILKEHQVQFDYFDILKDEEVRQGLKEFSEWPTYPQVYAKGELIGGLDIVKQLVESGQLSSALHVDKLPPQIS